MKQVKEFSSVKKANKWLKENQDKEIVDIKFSAWGMDVLQMKSIPGIHTQI